MSAESGAGHLDRQQIIIVRRRHSGEEAHHGGAWKIAFADFMTAMMALFLVMWLTNSSDNATKKQVAQYFNPIKLNDPSPSLRGIESKDGGVAISSNTDGNVKVEAKGTPGGKPIAGKEQGGKEQALFTDPYAVLAEIVAEQSKSDPDEHEGKPDGSGLPGLNGGEAYRDPFDPASWQLSPNTAAGRGSIDRSPPAEFQTEVLPADAPAKAKPADEASATDTKAAAAESAEGDKAQDRKAKGETPSTKEATKAEADDVERDLGASAATVKDARKVKEAITQELAKSGEAVPANLKVSAGKGGVTISLADDVTTGMFTIGSARPTPEVVKMMEKIATVLAKRDGNVVIRGHTDSRPFQNADYDNWRLSTARAQMAYYMLTRGGLDEARVKGIEGVADRDPKLPGSPEAAANRRIEILLSEPSP